MENDGRENFSDMEDDSPLSNTSHHSEDDDKGSECESQMTAASYLEESPPHDQGAFAAQQRELLERLKEQFTAFPFGANGFPGMDLSGDQNQRLQPEAQNDFPFSFPTPPPSKEEMKISSSTKKSSSNQHNNSWSYEDQFKQVRQLYEINDDPKRKDFLDELFMFMKERGTPINRLPIMAKSVLDLYELYKLVIQRGGLVNVINKKLWQEIIKDLNLPSSITSAAFTLRTQYTKYLYPFESEKFNLSSDMELQAAIENNKRDGSRRSTSNYSQFTPQSPQLQLQQQMAMASSMGASNNPMNMNMNMNLNLSNGNNQTNDLSNNQQLNEIQAAQQRFMMMMMLYNQFMSSSQPTT